MGSCPLSVREAYFAGIESHCCPHLTLRACMIKYTEFVLAGSDPSPQLVELIGQGHRVANTPPF